MNAARRVLVVDDDPLMRRTLANDFARHQFQVDTAESYLEALQRAGEHAPDLAVIDLWMPDCNGLEVVRALHLVHASVRAVILTGHASVPAAVEAVHSGALDLLMKPTDAEAILQAIAHGEQRAQEAQERDNTTRNQALAHKLATLSHDLKNPLSVIRLCSRLLLDRLPKEDETLHKTTTLIERSVQRMDRLVSALLDWDRLHQDDFTLSLKKESLPALLDEVLAAFYPLADQAGHCLVLEVDPHLETIECDHDALFRVFANLIENALKFTPLGKVIRVRAESVEGAILCSVIDQGVGIPEAEQPHLFERHWQGESSRTTGQGFGLGLFIASRIVAAHGSKLEVESVLGQGSRFWFRLAKKQ